MIARFTTASWIRKCVDSTGLTKAAFADVAGIDRHRFWGIYWGLREMTKEESELFAKAYCKLVPDGREREYAV